jgi:hypothetical protein
MIVLQHRMLKQKMNTGAQVTSHKLKTYALLLLCTFALVFPGSCATSSHKPAITQAGTVRAAQDVLLDMHFAIEKADAQAGLVRTRPLPGAQFFELWRSDNVGVQNQALSNLQNIRRTAEIRITEQNGRQRIDCVVNLQRLSLPNRDIDSAARAYQMFSNSSPLLQTLVLGSQVSDVDWVSLGRDSLLEKEILQRIEKRVAPHKTETKPSAEG